MALIGTAGTKSPNEAQPMTDRARKLLLEAQAAGKYLQYRTDHRDLLRKYTAKYDLHPA